MIEAAAVMQFCEELLPRQVTWIQHPTLLTFLVTTGQPGTHPEVALVRVARVTPGGAPTDVDGHVRGALPRPLLAGENVTLSVSDYRAVHGFQLKTPALRARGAEAEAYEVPGRGELVLHARQTFTVHHGPYDLNFFERVPFEDVAQTVSGATHGLLALGPQANVTPRFVWHRELRNGRLATFHGDGLTMKTMRNLLVNRTSVRVIFDLAKLEGYAIYGQTEEVTPEAEPEGWRAISAGFAAIGFGRPNKVFRHLSDRILPLALGPG